MTSKHCFSNILKEDFRHKIWMLALSVIGNFLAMPIVLLMLTSSARGYSVTRYDEVLSELQRVMSFFDSTLFLTAGIIALAGAVIVGLAGFRYVFHRNMVDTYHSIPVKRKTLFLAGWLNGFLIWFVPFVASFLACIFMGLAKVADIKKEFAGIGGLDGNTVTFFTGQVNQASKALVQDSFIAFFVLLIGFFMIYHLVILAVMLCGNILNTLVAGTALGAGLISLEGLLAIFASAYYDTYLELDKGIEWAMILSPLTSPVYLLYRGVMQACSREEGGRIGFALVVTLCIAITLLLGFLAYLAYRRRPSELAEQGLKQKWVRALVQVVITVAAGFSGWFLFAFVTAGLMGVSRDTGWAVFGALLFGILAFGVLNIVFNMDFRAFFKKKLMMLITVAATLVVGFFFRYDWSHFDTYLPDKEDIASIGIYCYGYSNSDNPGYSWTEPEHPIHAGVITDIDAIYAFLEGATEIEANGLPEHDDKLHVNEIYAKVNLKNGKSYYRKYKFTNYNYETVYDLMTQKAYLEAAYKLDTDLQINQLTMERGSGSINIRKPDTTQKAMFQELVHAYNLDLMEKSDLFIRGNDRLMCLISITDESKGWSLGRKNLEIFEGMTYTRQVLQKYGYASYADPIDPADVKELVIDFPYWYGDYSGKEGVIRIAAQAYGVKLSGYEAEESQQGEKAEAEAEAVENIMSRDVEEYRKLALHITEPAEIAELLALMSFDSKRYGRNGFDGTSEMSIEYIDLEGNSYCGYINDGKMPEKYILRFGTLYEELGK